jgi:diacylglycerol kinase
VPVLLIVIAGILEIVYFYHAVVYLKASDGFFLSVNRLMIAVTGIILLGFAFLGQKILYLAVYLAALIFYALSGSKTAVNSDSNAKKAVILNFIISAISVFVCVKYLDWQFVQYPVIQIFSVIVFAVLFVSIKKLMDRKKFIYLLSQQAVITALVAHLTIYWSIADMLTRLYG